MRELTPSELAKLEEITDHQTTKAKFSWDDTFQRKLLGMLLTDQYMLIQATDKIEAGYFSNEAHVLICDILLKYFAVQKAIPEKWIIENELREKLKDRDASVKLHYLAELHSVYDYYIPGLETREYLIDKITFFAKVQAVKIAFNKSLEKMQEAPEDEKTWSFVYEEMRKSMLIDRSYEPGVEYFMNLDEMFSRMDKVFEGKDRFTSGFLPIDDALTGNGLFNGQIASWIGLPGTGKSHPKDTPILMYDGTIKMIQDVVVGDLVMGDDSKSRTVLARHRFFDRKFEIRPVKGDSYFVNSKHILSLKNSHRVAQLRKDRGNRTGNKNYRNPTPCFANHPARMGDTNIYNISVEDWFKQTQHFKTKMKGWRVGVEFQEKEVKIDPYILGVWLGDGTSANCSFTNEDNLVRDSIFQEAKNRNMIIYELFNHHNDKKHGLTVAITSVEGSESVKNNSLYDDLKSYDLIRNKHVPQDYKVNSREVRLQILAGIIDTDGSKSCNGFEITQKREILADDICFLARSLGLAAYKKECKKKCNNNGVEGIYYRVFISGDCSVIPVRIERKKCTTRDQVKDVLLTGIDVIDTGEMDEFFGFEVDGNHLFLLGDFTVMHNSLALVRGAVQNVLLGHKVLYLTMEMDELGIMQRFTSQFAKLDINNLRAVKDEVYRTVEEFKKDWDDPNLLHVKQFPGGEMDVNGIRAYIAQLELRKFKPNLVIVDYVGEMKDDPNVKKYESAYRILRDLRGFGVSRGHCTMTCVQPNASAAKLEVGQYIDESNIGTSFDQFKPLDALWSINQQVIEKDAEVGRVFVIKHRNGRSRFPFKIGFDYKLGTLDMFSISKESYRERMNLVQEKKADEVTLDNIDLSNGKKQRSKRGFKGDDPLDNTYEAQE